MISQGTNDHRPNPEQKGITISFPRQKSAVCKSDDASRRLVMGMKSCEVVKKYAKAEHTISQVVENLIKLNLME
jgi:hypothetical protein